MTESNAAESIFAQALEKTDPAERTAYLDEACQGDSALRRQVERLLAAHPQIGGFLEKPIVGNLADPPSGERTNADSPTPARPSLDDTMAEGTSGVPLDEQIAFLTPSLKPGSLGRLGHYEILEIIGKGGFGIVLRAFDEKLHRISAIKVLSPAYAAVGSARKRFIREAQTAAAVKNEHVVAIYNVQDEAQPPYLVMELIDGISLQDKLDKKGPLSLKEILRIGMQMAEGLAAAHKQGLVHRDIKPANILLENGVERVKITDFGLARAVDDASITQSGTVAGTPMYMSPEQAEGLAIDHRSDLFSLGTVLYAMCTGHPPFRASGTHAVLKRVIDAAPRPMREINNEIPEWLSDIVAKLHAKKPEDRFQTAKELAELLGQRLADVQAGRVIERASRASEGSATVAPSPVAHASGSPRWRWIAAAALTLFIGITPIAAYFWSQYSASKRGQVDYEFEDPRVKITIDGGGDQSTYGGAVAVSEQRLANVTHTLRAYDRDGKEYFSHEFSVKPRGKTHVRVPAPPKTIEEPGWVQLFNGKDLTGWTGDTNVWNWKNDALNGTKLLPGGAIQMHSLRHQTTFKDFELKFQASIDNAAGLAAVTVRGKAGMPIGPARDVGSFSTDWGDPGKLIAARNQIDLKKALKKSGFNDFTIQCVGKRVTVSVNGVTTIDQEFADLPAEGPLAFKLFQGTTITPNVSIRNVEIRQLAPQTEPGWVQLFNGKNLDGWKTHPFKTGGWTVEDKELVGRGPGRYLFSERGDYENFHFRVEAQANAAANAGQVLRTPFGPANKDGYVGGYEADIGDFVGALIYYDKQGKRVSPPAPERFVKENEWFTQEVIARGNHIMILVNGKKVVDHVDMTDTYRRGHLALQAWRPKTVVRFRKIEVKEIPPVEPGWVKLFNGKDLTGWKTIDKGTWSVEKGELVGRGKQYSMLLTERADFANFHLRGKAKVVDAPGPGKAGIWMRMPLSMAGYKAQLSTTAGEHGALLVRDKAGDKPALMHKNLAGNLPPDTWFDFEIIVDGQKLVAKMAGNVMATGTDLRYQQGWIGLEVWPKSLVHFKDLEIKELPAPNAPASLKWNVIDPMEDSQVGNLENRITFRLPAKVRSLIVTETSRNFDAPRILTKVSGDFTLYVQVPRFARPLGEQIGLGSPIGGAGLVIWQDEDHFVTLLRQKISTLPSEIAVFSGASKGKHFKTPPTSSKTFKADSPPVWLGLERRGQLVRGYFSHDGMSWDLVREQTVEFGNDVKVGMVAIQNTKEGFTADLDYFAIRAGADGTITEMPGKAP